jgi:hypothetical protein
MLENDRSPFPTIARAITLGAALLALAGCSTGEVLNPVHATSTTTVDAGPPPPPEAMPGCNPLIGADCLSPFPSSFFEAVDPTTQTGFRVSLPQSVVPPIQYGPALSVERYNQKDGFSPATPFVVYFPSGVDVSQMPTILTLEGSVNPTSPVQIIDYETGERLPVFAEMDVRSPSSTRHALLIHPMIRLQPERRYVIALVGLQDPDGKPVEAAPFIALRDQNALSESLMPLASRFEEIFAALSMDGVPRSALTLAWDVYTASDTTATSHLVGMRDTALGLVDTGMVTYSVASRMDTPDDPNLLRQVVFTVQGPSFLADDSGHSFMNFGPDGQPALRGMDPMPVVVKIPQCAATATGPLPLIVFGHGLFGNAEQTLATPLLEQVGNQACVVFIGTDWIGLSSSDLPNLADYLPQDLNNVYIVTDRLQQAHVNAQVMTHLFLSTLKDDPSLAVNGHAVTDGSDVSYFGISLGGIQGNTFMALTPDVARGALNVAGCEWSLMIDRSTDFAELEPIIDIALPDPVNQQHLMGLLQSEWDYADPISYAPHLLRDPLPGSFTKQILVQESVGDAQVPNIATRTLARTIGLPGLDLIFPLYGIDAQPAPLDSAYTQWDAHLMPRPPLTDTALSSDNGAHDAVYQYVPAQTQILTFLKPGGQVLQTCTGPCNFSGG